MKAMEIEVKLTQLDIFKNLVDLSIEILNDTRISQKTRDEYELKIKVIVEQERK